MKIFTLILLTALILTIEELTSTKVEPTTSEKLFKPLGRLIPELSWATVRTKINIEDLFNETNQICRATVMMEKEYKRLGKIYGNGQGKIRIPPTKVTNTKAYTIQLLAMDIKAMCLDNTIRIEEIIDVFNLKKIKKPKYIPNMKNNKTSLLREARQIVTGTMVAAVEVVTSLMSIFTTNELMSMSSSKESDGELIDNNNNIIKSLQSHENAIHRNEAEIKIMENNAKKLELYLALEKENTETFIGLSGIQGRGSTIVHHLQRVQDGLYQLLKNKLSPKLVPLTNLQGLIGKLQDITRKRGYNLAINSPSEIYMCQTSFVAYENGQLIILTHIPMYKTKYLMKLLEYQPTPIILTNQENQQLTIKPDKPTIAVEEDLTLFSVYSKEEIHHDCWSIHNSHYCKNNNILTRTVYPDCTLAIYRKNKEEIQKKCAFEISSPHEVIIQLNSTTFYTYTPNKTDLFIHCPEKAQEKKRIKGFNSITLNTGCRANLDKHVLTSGIEVEETIVLKQNNLDLHLLDILKVEIEEENEFLELIEDEQQRTRKPVNIVDVQKKFHLKMLQKKNGLFQNILESVSGIRTLIVLLIVAVLLYKFCVNKRERRNQSNTFCHYDTLKKK